MGSRILHLTAAAALMAALQVPAWAQDNPAQTPSQAPPAATEPQPSAPPSPQPPADTGDHRFVFHRIDGGFLRLDMHTGAVASCSPNGSGWACVTGRDERASLDREIAQLQRDNATLKNALLEHGVPLPEGMAPNPPAAPGAAAGEEPIPRPPQTVPPTATAPTSPRDSEISRIVDAVEKGWRRLVEMMTNLQRDLQKKE